MRPLAGELRERVTLYVKAGRDAAGARLPFAEGPEHWASVQPERPRIGTAGERHTGQPRWRIVMRADAAPLPGDRLKWKQKTFEVLFETRDPRLPDRVTLIAEERP